MLAALLSTLSPMQAGRPARIVARSYGWLAGAGAQSFPASCQPARKNRALSEFEFEASAPVAAAGQGASIRGAALEAPTGALPTLFASAASSASSPLRCGTCAPGCSPAARRAFFNSECSGPGLPLCDAGSQRKDNPPSSGASMSSGMFLSEQGREPAPILNLSTTRMAATPIDRHSQSSIEVSVWLGSFSMKREKHMENLKCATSCRTERLCS